VGNWDIVMPYDERATAFLTKEGLPHPVIAPGNRSPTVRELISLDRATDAFRAGVVFDVWESDEDAVVKTLRMRGETYDAQLRVIYALAEICGQQWIYPDSGAPSIIVDPRIDFARALCVWKEANHRDDGWEWLYRELYGNRSFAE
jgi:hypothetical protein